MRLFILLALAALPAAAWEDLSAVSGPVSAPAAPEAAPGAAPAQEALACLRRAIRSYQRHHPETSFLLDGCAWRAQELYALLRARCGYRALQLWAQAPPGGSFSPIPGISWRYHTALYYTADGGRMVIDPALETPILPYEDWRAQCTAQDGAFGSCTATECGQWPADMQAPSAESWRAYGRSVDCHYACAGQSSRDRDACGSKRDAQARRECAEAASRSCVRCRDLCSQSTGAAPLVNVCGD